MENKQKKSQRDGSHGHFFISTWTEYNANRNFEGVRRGKVTLNAIPSTQVISNTF